MRSSRVVLTRLVLLCFLFVFISDALAKRPVRDTGGDNGCLSNKELTNLARQALPELQAIDATVALKDVKAVTKTVGDCATTAAVSLVLEAYALELTTVSQPTNSPPSINGSPATTVMEGSAYKL